MAETLYIRLGTVATEPVYWLIYDNTKQEIIASGELAAASELAVLAEKSQSRQVVTFVSGADVSLKAVTVPGKSQRAIHAATPYMLEDDLADDVDQLFFAFADKPTGYHGDENCFVAIVKHQQMHLWQQWLADAGIECRLMLPETLALPVVKAQWSVVELGGQLIVRQNNWLGCTLDASWQDTYFAQLNQRLENTDEQEQQQTIEGINYYSPLTNIDSGQLTCLQFNHQPEELPLALLAKGVATTQFNLLQGQYQVKKKRSPLLKRYLLVAGVAALALVLHLTMKGLQLIELSNQYANLNEQIVKDYKKAFPQSRKVQVNLVRTLVNQKLKAIGGDSSVGFLNLLDKLRPAFAQVKELKPHTLKYDAKRQEIRLNVSAANYQTFERFKQQLEQANFIVNTGAQNNQGDEITGSFTIRYQS